MKHAILSLFLVVLCPAAMAEGHKYAAKPGAVPSTNLPGQPLVAFINGSDSCATPDVITGPGPHAFDNTTATTGSEGQTEPLCLAFGFTTITRDVWFTWTAPMSGTAFLDICSSGSGVDTKVAIYNGTACPTGAAIACNDDACPGLQSNVSFPITMGNSYVIQVGTYPGGGGAAGGPGSFTITSNATPANDNCATPTIISGNGPHAYDSAFASTGTQGQTNARCYIFNTSTIAYDIWFQWTATSTGWVALDTCAGGTHDLKVAVYAGAGCPTGEPIICDDDYCGTIGSTSKAPFFATMGNTYTFQIGSYPGQTGAPGNFVISPFTPVAGDDCAAPVDIAGNGPFAWDAGSAVTGQQGQSEALCGGEMVANDQWFRWTSFCTGTVTVTMCSGSATDNKLAAYAGSSCPTAGSALACDDDFCGPGSPSQISFSATLGQTYMIQVGLWPGEVPGSGTFSINTPCPPPVGTVFCIGDGVAPHTPCPCANHSATADGVGCLHSGGTGGKLRASGFASLSNDGDGTASLFLEGSLMTNSSVLYFQGTTQQSGGNGASFGDGLRCAGGTVIRLGTKTNVGGASSYPVSGDIPVSIRGSVTIPGTIRTYQAWYRNAAPFCLATTFNLTNGLEITWGP